MALIEIKDLSKIYGEGDATTVALDSVSLDIKKGDFVAIMGPSGSGKSTLMHMIGLLDRPTHGSYHLDGKDVSNIKQRQQAKVRREQIGFIFQTFNVLPRMTAIENVALPLMYQRVKTAERLKRAAAFMKNVGLEDRQYYMPNQLSGGQVQRVAVARALVNKPKLVLADEPTGNLDTAASAKIMDLLKEINKGGNTIIMVTHEPELASYADRVIYLQDGKIVDTPPHLIPTKSQKTSKKTTKAKKASKKS